MILSQQTSSTRPLIGQDLSLSLSLSLSRLWILSDTYTNAETRIEIYRPHAHTSLLEFRTLVLNGMLSRETLENVKGLFRETARRRRIGCGPRGADTNTIVFFSTRLTPRTRPRRHRKERPKFQKHTCKATPRVRVRAFLRASSSQDRRSWDTQGRTFFIQGAGPRRNRRGKTRAKSFSASQPAWRKDSRVGLAEEF